MHIVSETVKRSLEIEIELGLREGSLTAEVDGDDGYI